MIPDSIKVPLPVYRELKPRSKEELEDLLNMDKVHLLENKRPANGKKPLGILDCLDSSSDDPDLP